MELLYALASIAVITAVAGAAKKFFPFSVCPICAGVFGTWLWMLVSEYLGVFSGESWKIITAILMGGSAVGIAYGLEKRLSAAASPFLWKALSIPAGFAMVYSLVTSMIWGVLLSAAFLAFLAFWFFVLKRGSALGDEPQNKEKWKVEELKKKLKDCC
ncbi:MAG: hypothetical protein A2847_00740 [Candidatus Sungbacteria bacterium RIFCSPHIGHO2_01_FULL_50_25]|uniref:Uncharacterized protein n=1 Tax=Candidatus Sungbacteria bacterium RIFCSPHIGHO2_01_FULL_50_25 TaxID=1802265 RepID=A0A1G2KBZ2_9BACT|nr:MAG: hypothetical protein A2847_00740 [Candidatus Sungbacteria bacterium RIFCSPHIGHO2_01_FULL_50_25]